jgi:phosphoribosylformylglycinamidine synthase
LGLSAIQDVRVGKNITVQVTADSVDQAKELARTAAEKLLANPVMEYFELDCRPA